MTDSTVSTVLVVGDDLDPERVIADLLAIDGPIRVYLQDGPHEATIASRIFPSETIAGVGPIPVERVIFAADPRPGSDQIALWPDLVLAYPGQQRPSLTWAFIAHAVDMGLLVAVWLPWLDLRTRVRDGGYQAIKAGLAPYGAYDPPVVDRGGLRVFPFADRQVEGRQIGRTLQVMHALVRAGGDD